MDKLKNIQVFCRVVELGTFVAVAQEMKVSPMMISKYMRSLEDSLGVSLINRKTRKLYVTELGQRYYQQSRLILDDLNNLENAIIESEGVVKGVLKINVPIDFGGIYMLPVINAYQQQYPDVNVLMTLDNASVDLRSGKFDICIVVTDTLNPDVIARKIAQTSLCTYASPMYIEQYGTPDSVQDLEQHKCLHYIDTPHADAWVFIKDRQRIEIRPEWSFASNNGRVLCQAAALGMGIIRSPALSVRSYVQSGELVEILLDYKLPDLCVYASYLPSNYYPAKITTFIDFLVDYFAE
ncbi:MAG: LysR family transcriptional regulator [Gammaproteobacteria bacterium]|nr:MAG: LysR family transcriptional regulator [Gammaproteobacteria bacterium]